MSPKERGLYESISNSYLLGLNNDTTTTNHLSLMMTQQRAMQNYKIASNWISDLETNLDDMRDAVNRKMQDLLTGVQRRNYMLRDITHNSRFLLDSAKEPASATVTNNLGKETETKVSFH